MMQSPYNIELLLTPESPCNYLSGRNSQLLCLGHQQPGSALFSSLTEQGFRRSGNFIYRPQCQQCQACVPVRIAAAQFVPNRQQRKLLNRAKQLQISEHAPGFTQERYQLYHRYISQRHRDGSMFPPSIEQFEHFLCTRFEFARFYEFRLNNKLVGVAVTDILYDGLSAVYSFYEPADNYYSYGALAILWQINHVRQLQLDYLYLGYWIKNHDKMHYKIGYQPIQGLIGGNWQNLVADTGNNGASSQL